MKSRICHPPVVVPAVEWTEYGWDIGNRIVPQISVVEDIDKYLKKIGFIKQQKPLEAYINNVQQHIAPYRFFIISLDPLVVVMTPYDYGETNRKSNAELASPMSKQHLTYSAHLVNGYHYGSSVPKSTSYKWFSPEQTKGIQEAAQDGKIFTIRTKSATLLFGDIENNGWYVVTRR
ncbi:MAG: hypothetical protein L0Y36_02870 [Planctomycetales bacterium]|nr:hypothetical protein [Planctomycetales bacterium]